MVFEATAGRGTVHTYTVIRQNHAQPFKSELPYVVAIVELDEGPRLMANVTDVDGDGHHRDARREPMARLQHIVSSLTNLVVKVPVGTSCLPTTSNAACSPI